MRYDLGVILLAIDTCDPRGSVSVADEKGEVTTAVHETGEPYSSWLFSEVGRLVKAAVGEMSRINGYAVASGPGSFTGVRVGLTAVKAWAEVYGRPVIAVSRLEAVAMQSHSGSDGIAAYLDAHRGEVFGAFYRKEGRQLTAVGQEMVGSPEEFVDWVLSQARGKSAGWISPDVQLLADGAQREQRWPEVELASFRLAPIIAEIAAERFRRGILADAVDLDANYVRRCDAEIFWKSPRAGGKLG